MVAAVTVDEPEDGLAVAEEDGPVVGAEYDPAAAVAVVLVNDPADGPVDDPAVAADLATDEKSFLKSQKISKIYLF